MILDFNKIKKEYMTIKLPDAEKTTIMISSPSKNLFEKLLQLQVFANTKEVNIEAIEAIYDLCSQLMSKNKGGVHISREKLEQCLDFEDLLIFMSNYITFINDELTKKN